MFFAVCISITNPHSNTSFTIQLIKIVTKKFTASLLYLVRQFRYGVLNLSRFFIVTLIHSVTQESSALSQMVHSSSQHKTVTFLTKVKFLMEAHMPVIIGITPVFIISPLPTKKSVIKRILFLHMPQMQCII